MYLTHLMPGSPHSDLGRQVPFWSEADHHRHLRPAPGMRQQAQPPPCGGGHCQGKLILSSFTSSYPNLCINAILLLVASSKLL